MKTINKTYRLSGLLSCVILVGACATTQPALVNSDNSAVKSNIAAQSIAPPAAQKANRNIPQDPRLRAAARERYQTGKVTPPKESGTR